MQAHGGETALEYPRRAMKANVGDRLLVESSSSEQHRRQGETIEVHARDGPPPFLVRWTDGHESP
jgi:hypothetical protein